MNENQSIKIRNLIAEGSYKEALDNINKFQKKESLTGRENLTLLNQKCEVFTSLGEYSKTITLAIELRKESKKQKDLLLEIDALSFEIYANYRLNKYEYVSGLVQTTEDLINSCSIEGINIRKSKLLVNKVFIDTAKGDIDQAYIFAQENFHLCEEIADSSHLARAYYLLGWVYSERGDIDTAIDNFQKSLDMREKMRNQWSLAHSLFSLGYSWLNKGELDNAQKCLSRSLKIREKIGNQQDISWTLLNLGDIHREKDDLKQAQTHYEESLLINQSISYKLGIVFSLMRLSLIFENLEDPQLVLDTLEKALNYTQEVENVDPEVYVLFDLIHFITKRKLSSADIDTYLRRLQEINIQYKNKIFDQTYRLADALILKSSKSIKNRKKAQAILQQITEEEIVNYLFTKIAMINYSEILAVEIKKYFGDGILVSELTELSDTLSPVQFQLSYSTAAEQFLNLSKSALAEIDIKKARELLRRTQYLCDFLNLYNKGPTPFRIMFLLFMKERSLNNLSNQLKITKGALTGHLKLLANLNLIKVSREEQVRSAQMLKKYYVLSSKGKDLIQPLNTNIIDSIEQKEGQFKSFIDSFMIPRLMIKIIRDTTHLIDKYQNFLEEQVLLKPDPKKDETDSKKELEKVKKLFNFTNEITLNHLFLSDNQYEKYMKLWKEFTEKVKNEVLIEEAVTSTIQTDEKSNYVAQITLPIKELLELEIYLEIKRKEKREKP